MKYILLISIIIFLLACSTIESEQDQLQLSTVQEIIQTDSNSFKNIEDSLDSSSTNKQRTSLNNKEFLTFYKKFSAAIRNKDVVSFNECMDTNFGFYIIESPGALPFVCKVYDISKFKSKNNNTGFFELSFNNISNLPIFEELPKVVCENEIYDKKGCFANTINPLQDSQLWNYSDLNEKEIQPIQKLSSLINITVINTYNYTFYFSFIENKWSISFIDIRIPCQA
ncbi:MAG: hypothetical protein COX70_02635 [Flavobacteriales bacterium CG_4_10_14_0_2_um_filter_32_8]|nr:MAG: hypothetical protein COX70_02635 [Flavobacteriales bacterium CG_4_10_14_0_2_um_filter_32_8]PJB13941.1 MAG: hypothetical protein CO118_11170 [Flavobacteriales bacterium CG_4_9_14_3_um_filter_32_8]